ncbi:hypothetical protein [Acinetobacter baumannii]|uniref:hypothetical protein n=1 Tax=Acinetobacter baumannii TaxID=470 RepID=UPI003B517EBB
MYQIMLPNIRPMGGFNDFHNESFYVWDEVNDYLDCSVCDYRASSWLINPNGNKNSALLVAGELLSLLMGYLRLCNLENLYSHVKLNEIKVFYGNHSTAYSTFEEIQIPNFFLSEVWTEREQFKPNNPREINNLSKLSFDTLLYMAKSQEDIYILLKLMAERTSWFTLYKIYESLETFTTMNSYPFLINIEKGKKMISVLDLESEKEKLTKPANNFSLVGLYARHGYKQHVKPINTTNCFSLDEAKNFVYKHVKRYIVWKVSEFHKSDLFNG